MSRLLIADDLADSADSLAMLMRHSGHEVETAYDGEEALRLVEARPPDVVLLDIEMPKLSGYEVCRRIRQHPWGRAVVVIAVTGWSDDATAARITEAGFDHQLVKPVDPSMLERLLEGRTSAS